MTMSQSMTETLRFTGFIMPLVIGDLTEDLARRRTRGHEGPSIAWIVGHLTHYRYLMSNLLGDATEDPMGELFAEGASDGSGYPAMEELRDAWNGATDLVTAAVAGTSDNYLNGPMPGASGPHAERRVLDSMIFYLWHESYHMGQLGTLRAQYGLTPTATLATGG